MKKGAKAHWKIKGRRGLYDIGVVSDILSKLGGSEISGGVPIEGTTIQWSADTLNRAITTVEVCIDKAPGGAE